MASLTYKRTTTEKVTLKGILNENATIIDCDGEEIEVQNYLDKFASGYVEIIIGNKTEEDLTEEESAQESD